MIVLVLSTRVHNKATMYATSCFILFLKSTFCSQRRHKEMQASINVQTIGGKRHVYIVRSSALWGQTPRSESQLKTRTVRMDNTTKPCLLCCWYKAKAATPATCLVFKNIKVVSKHFREILETTHFWELVFLVCLFVFALPLTFLEHRNVRSPFPKVGPTRFWC